VFLKTLVNEIWNALYPLQVIVSANDFIVHVMSGTKLLRNSRFCIPLNPKSRLGSHRLFESSPRQSLYGTYKTFRKSGGGCAWRDDDTDV